MLEGLTPPVVTRSCKIGSIVETLDAKDKDILLKAVMDKENWPVKALARALRERGLEVSDTPISNHRAKACACFG